MDSSVGIKRGLQSRSEWFQALQRDETNVFCFLAEDDAVLVSLESRGSAPALRVPGMHVQWVWDETKHGS